MGAALAITNLISSTLDARDVGTGKIKRYDSALGGVGKTGAGLGPALAIGTAAIAALAVAVGAGVKALLNHAAAVDAIGKQAQLLDLPTEEFDRYRIAASLAGVEANATLKGLQTFRRVAEEEFAGKKTIFAEIGVDVETAAGGLKSFNDLLTETLTALKSQPELRLMGGEQIFGARGAGLLRLGSGAELTSTMADLEQRGLGRGAAQTGTAADLIDAQTLLTEANDALRSSIDEVLSPVVTTWIERLDSVVTVLNQNQQTFQIGVAAMLEAMPFGNVLFKGAIERARAGRGGAGGGAGEDGLFVGPSPIDPNPEATAIREFLDRQRPELQGIEFGGAPLGFEERRQFSDILDRLDRSIRAFQASARPGRLEVGRLEADLIELPADEVHELNAAYQAQFEILDQATTATASVVQLTDAIAQLAGTSDTATQLVVNLIKRLLAAIEAAEGGDPDILGVGLGVIGGAFFGPAGAAAGAAIASQLRESSHRDPTPENETKRAERANSSR